MRSGYRLVLAICFVAGLTLLAGRAAAQSWSNALLLNDSSEAGTDVKTARVVASKDGGFHSIYHSANRIRYRRYVGGALGSIVDVFPGTNFISGGRITEALNGEIHVVFEDWAGSGPEVRWYKSSNGGASFPYTQILTASGMTAKHPLIAPFGTGSSAEVVMSYWQSGSHDLMYTRYNGTTWSAEAGIGSDAYSQYDCFGMARSPLDGSIYRSFDTSRTAMAMRQYTGTWGGMISLYSGGWPVRQHMAINTAGQVMLIWDQDSTIKTQLYTPGSGPGPVIELGAGGYSGSCDVCWIPDSNDFYMVLAKPVGSKFHVIGRRWAGGGWLPEESVQNGLADDFIVDPSVSCGPSGEMYCAFEHWASGKPQQYYTVKPAIPPGPRGYVAGVVRDQYGAPVAGAIVSIANIAATVSFADGSYSLRAPVGTYTVDCGRNYYAGQSFGGVTISEGQTTSLSFAITALPPGVMTNLVALGYDQHIQLRWANPGSGNHTGTRIRYSTSGYPATPNDGQLLADVPASQYVVDHSGLTNNVTYYYAAFTYFDDASRTYAAGVRAVGTPVGVPKPNLLANAGIDSFTGGVANNWTAYTVNAAGAITFNSDTANYVSSPSQGIFGIDSTLLPATGYSSAGIRQVVSGVVPNKIYHFIARQDLFTSDYNYAGRRYVLNFGINPVGGTDPGVPGFDGMIPGVRWMTANQALYNSNNGGPIPFGGFHKSWAAYPAAGSSLSVWSGLTIDNSGPRDDVSAKFNTDLAFLFEWDVPANSGLQNGDFEGPIINLQNVDSGLSGGDTIPSGWVPCGGSCGQWSALLTEPEGKRSGAYGVRVANRRGTIDGGLMQRIACTPGRYQTFTAYAITSGQDGTVGSVGIDPTGGIDIYNPSIFWTTTQAAAWTPISVSATARASAITVFIRSTSTTASTSNYHYTYYDDCTWQEGAAIPLGVIAGVVTDSCGTPMADAVVSTNVGGYSATTAADGTYTLADVDPGTYTVTASKTGYSLATQSVVVTGGQTSSVNFAYTTGGNAGLAGYIRNVSGLPITAAQVTASPGGYSATTGADGSYMFEYMPTGTYTVVASATGYAALQRTNMAVTGCRFTHVDFTLGAPTYAEKIVNGAMNQPYRSFWGGEIPNPTCGIDPGSQCWGATWRGTFSAAKWGRVGVGGSNGDVVRMYNLASGFEAGIVQQVPGLTPGATYTFSAQSYPFDTGTTAWIAVDSTGGTTLPSRSVSFDNIPGQWNSKSVSGTVGSGGVVTVFLWAYRSGTATDVYFDNASLIVTTPPASQPAISRWPLSLAAVAPKGTNAPAQSFDVSNSATGTLSYSVTTDQSWLAVTPAAGTSTGEIDAVTVSFATAALAPGAYSATITVSAAGAVNSPQTVGVALVVVGAGDLDADGDADLNDFAAFQGCFNGPNRPPAQANCGSADFDHDGDVDLTDFATFQGCFNGPNRPPACP